MKILIALLLLLTIPFVAQQSVPTPIRPSGWSLGNGSTFIDTGSQTSILAGYGASFSQNFSVSPKQIQAWTSNPNYLNEGFYTLSFSVQNYFPTYPGYYQSEIDFGTQELGEVSGWGTHQPKQVTVTFPASNYIVIDKALPDGGLVQGSSNFELNFTVTGWPLLFSNVSLTFTPDVN